MLHINVVIFPSGGFAPNIGHSIGRGVIPKSAIRSGMSRRPLRTLTSAVQADRRITEKRTSTSLGD